MDYEIKADNGATWGMAPNTAIANIFAQALREKFRDHDFTVHPVRAF